MSTLFSIEKKRPTIRTAKKTGGITGRIELKRSSLNIASHNGGVVSPDNAQRGKVFIVR